MDRVRSLTAAEVGFLERRALKAQGAPEIPVEDREEALDALARQEVPAPGSCKLGSCCNCPEDGSEPCSNWLPAEVANPFSGTNRRPKNRHRGW